MKYLRFIPRLLAAALLLPLLSVHLSAQTGSWLRFEVWTSDSLAVSGVYYPAAVTAEPVVVLLHDRGEEVKHFGILAARLQERGSPVVIPDFRGEGASTMSRRGRVYPAQRWGQAERTLLKRDLQPVFAFAARQEGNAERNWVVVTSGEAAAIGFELAAEDTRFTKVACLSPRLQPDFDKEILKRCERTCICVCDGDAEAMASTREIERVTPEWHPLELEILECRARGQSLIRWQPAAIERLMIWLAE